MSCNAQNTNKTFLKKMVLKVEETPELNKEKFMSYWH